MTISVLCKTVSTVLCTLKVKHRCFHHCCSSLWLFARVMGRMTLLYSMYLINEGSQTIMSSQAITPGSRTLYDTVQVAITIECLKKSKIDASIIAARVYDCSHAWWEEWHYHIRCTSSTKWARQLCLHRQSPAAVGRCTIPCKWQLQLNVQLQRRGWACERGCG